MLDSRAITTLINLAIEERDRIRWVLEADKRSPETRQRIADWKSGRVAGYFPAGETTSLEEQLRPRTGFGRFHTAYQQANADVIQSRVGSYLLPKLEAVYKSHIALLDEAQQAYKHSSTRLMSLDGHCSAVSALIDLVRLYDPKNRPGDGQSADLATLIQPRQAKTSHGETNHETSEFGQQDQAEPTGEAIPEPSPNRFAMTIDRWDNLGIGIDEGGSYLAVSPCPTVGDVFPKEKTTPLHLPGKQWEELLKLLAASDHSNSAKKQDVMWAFQYFMGHVTAEQIYRSNPNSPLKNGGQTNRIGRRSSAAALAACPPRSLRRRNSRQPDIFGCQSRNSRFERERRFASARVQKLV